MKRRAAAAVAIVVGIAVAAGLARGWPEGPAAGRVRQALGLAPADSSASAVLAAAGVHKCLVRGAVVYTDQPCPAGSRALAAGGGTVTVVEFPKPAPAATPAALAASLAGGRVLREMDPAERDRLRDKEIDDAMNRR
ncbi:MAG: hypothetical protein ACTHL8_06315 [Burkholderiaceae bacterium]